MSNPINICVFLTQLHNIVKPKLWFFFSRKTSGHFDKLPKKRRKKNDNKSEKYE